MSIIIRRKKKFARNRSREQEAGSLFSKTSSGLSNAFSLIIAIFTPALITSSIASTEILLPLANIFLSLGYLTNFSYRIYNREISHVELMVSALALAGFVAAAFLLFPPAGAVISVLSAIQLINQAAVAINLFFVVKHVLVPPIKHVVEKIAKYLGYDISRQYCLKPALTLEKDRFAVDRILEKDYGHDSHSKKYNSAQLSHLNKLLTKLTFYISKYDELLLGYIRHKDKITALEKSIESLSQRGDPDSSYSFIKEKIRFKTTKVQLLQDAVAEVQVALAHPGKLDDKALSYFHIPLLQRKRNRTEMLKAGLDDLQYEIKRQQVKINSLQECLPLSVAMII